MAIKKQKQIPVMEFYNRFYSPLSSLYEMVTENLIEWAEAVRILQWNICTPMKISFIGEFNHGKSSVINLLLERENLLPTSNKKETTVVTNVFPLFNSDFSEFSITHEHGILIDKEKGTHEILNLNDLQNIMNDPSKVSKVYELNIYVENEFLKKNVILIDTPGFYIEFGKKEFPTEIAKMSDIIVLVSDLNKPLTKFHDNFLKEIGIHTGKVIMVINKADLTTGASDIREAMTHISTYQKDLKIEGPKFLISSIEQGEGKETKDKWDNEEFKKYMFSSVMEKRFENKSRNWVLNTLEILYNKLNKSKKRTEKFLEKFEHSINNIEDEAVKWDDLIKKTREKYLSQRFQLDQRLQLIKNSIEKIVHKYSNEVDVNINSTLTEWRERKHASLIQKKVKNIIIEGIVEAINEYSKTMKREVDEFNKFWFKRFSKLPDARILDVNMTIRDAMEVRSIIYQFIFEKQCRWKYKEWNEFVEMLREKGYEKVISDTGVLSSFVKRMRELLFDLSSDDYILRKITDICKYNELTDEEKRELTRIEWKEIQDAGLFSRIFLGTSFEKLKDQIREKAEDARESKFREIQSKFLSVLKKFSENARKNIQTIETEFRNELVSTMEKLKKESIKNTANELIIQLEEILKDIPLPFEE